MKDIYAWMFRDDASVDSALARCKAAGLAGFTFGIRDSDETGRYLKCAHENGTRTCVRTIASNAGELESGVHGAAGRRA